MGESTPRKSAIDSSQPQMKEQDLCTQSGPLSIHPITAVLRAPPTPLRNLKLQLMSLLLPHSRAVQRSLSPRKMNLPPPTPVATSFSYYNQEPEASANQPANNSFYPEEEPEPTEDELTTSFYQPVTTSYSYSAKKFNYNCLSNIIEESETSTDEVAMPTPTKSTPTKKRPSKRSEKTVSKAPRQSTSGRGRHSKK